MKKGLIERKEYLGQLKSWRETEIIKVVTGVRRCGKSTLFELYIDYLKQIGVSDEQIVWVNLEEKENSHLLNEDVLYAFLKSRLLKDKWTYYFIDEIQMCENYERAIDSLFVKKTADIYITGSNAYMLSGELATLLSGRYIKIDMLPLSFAEFSQLVEMPDKRKRFDEYMEFGSLPYISKLDTSEAKSKYLEGVYNTILVKDVVIRKKISDVALLENIIKFMVSNVGSPISTNSITEYLQSNNRKISVNTVDNYVKAITDGYLFYQADRYDVKGKVLLSTLGKFYVSDVGFRRHLLSTEGKDLGHIIENIVYLELIRRGFRVNIGKVGEKEIDFVATKMDVKEYYQVSTSVVDKEVLERELASLKNTKDHHPKFLLTLDYGSANHSGIRQVNLIDWLLEKMV